MFIQFLVLVLTPAVREAVVPGGTLRAVSANHVGPAGALTAKWLACIALRPGLMAATWYSTVIEES